MEDFSLAILTALWLGLLTSVSPCHLATNITAMSYIGKEIQSPKRLLLSGFMYTFGRTIIYFVIGVLLVGSLVSIPAIADFLQHHMNQILGPVLMVAGMFLLDLIKLPHLFEVNLTENLEKKVAKNGIFGSFLLGLLFSLAFCPVTAALFFGSLIPLSVKHESFILLPAIYGTGTAMPVMFFALVLVFSNKALGKVFNTMTGFELWARRITGVIFILVGIYLTLESIFGIHLFHGH